MNLAPLRRGFSLHAGAGNHRGGALPSNPPKRGRGTLGPGWLAPPGLLLSAAFHYFTPRRSARGGIPGGACMSSVFLVICIGTQALLLGAAFYFPELEKSPRLASAGEPLRLRSLMFPICRSHRCVVGLIAKWRIDEDIRGFEASCLSGKARVSLRAQVAGPGSCAASARYRRRRRLLS